MDEKWEYLPMYLEAQVKSKDMRAYLKQRFDVKSPPKYMVESMAPIMNELGEEGWELVHMEPVARLRGKGDVMFPGAMRTWSNVYFCVFKRRKSVQQVMPVRSDGQPAFPAAAQQVSSPPHDELTNPLPHDDIGTRKPIPHDEH